MNEDNNSLSFGGYLKSIRLEKGITLEEVSDETKIRINNLILIEEEDIAKLPAEIFVKSFLRAYANAIGADEDEVIRRYELSGFSLKKPKEPKEQLNTSKCQFWCRIILFIGIFIGIIVLSVLFIPNSEEKESLNRQIGQIEQEITTENIKVDSIEVSKNNNSNIIEEKLILKVIAVEETWMKVTIDDLKPKEYNLKSGDCLEMEATSGFNLIISNAKGVNLILNGDPITIKGKSGQIVDIQIP